MLEDYALGKVEAKGVPQCWDLLKGYWRRLQERVPKIEAITGLFFGRLSDEPPAERLLASLLSYWGSLAGANLELLEGFGEALLGDYRIHDWARGARGSVDCLRKPP